jgi:hypothetical protein
MRATGRVDAADVERGITAVEQSLKSHARVAIHAEIDISGMTPRALVKDIGYGLSKLGELRRFSRAAVVTDQRWVRWIASVEGALFPIDVRVFALSQKDAAMAWASEPPVPETNAT